MKYLLYDGHASVRHLADNSGTITDSYNYDAYGNPRNFDPTSAATSLLYAGEFYDSIATQYYLRARWYSPLTGRFNRIDPFAGNNRDPQSLHKYLYAHNNPVNGSDPSGMFFTGGIGAIALTVVIGTIIGVLGYTFVAGTFFKPSRSARCSGRDCSCGPDITFGLKMLSAKLEADFSFWVHPLSDIDYLAGVFNPVSGWGIYGLDNRLTKEPISLNANPSGYGCAGTVTVSGKCHKGSTVNYWLWGRVTALEGDSLTTAISILTFWKKAVWRGEDLEEASMWTIAGHENIFDVYEETKPDCTACTEKWLEPLKYKWGW